MVVGDFHLAGAAIVPSENDPPLLVDFDGPETGKIALQRVKMIAWRQRDLCKFRGHVDLHESPFGPFLNVPRKFPGTLRTEYFRGFLARERVDHRSNVA